MAASATGLRVNGRRPRQMFLRRPLTSILMHIDARNLLQEHFSIVYACDAGV
jgi:hypothetical protein